MKKIIMIAGGALVLVGASVGATLFLTGGSEPAVAPVGADGVVQVAPVPMAETHYYELDPEFVVNFGGKSRSRFFMAEVSLSTTDEAVIEILEKHDPELRNDLLMLFGNQDAEYISTADGKTELRQNTLDTVQEVVKKHYGAPVITDVFFTRFVVQ
ncbi:MAG TPA: hypothetical protein DD979_01900 [Gammaproteobacteria bacterium]|jgi:flagellar FliL protein|nr:hypothetical protein [Gammaproteobacteria bacterium]